MKRQIQMGDDMRYIVDRIEGDYAVLEDLNKEIISVHLSDLPESIEEGNVIYKNGGEYKINKEEEKQRRDLIIEKMDAIWDD